VIHVWLTTIMSTGIFGWMGYEMVFFLCIMTNIDLVRRAEIAGNAALLKFVDAGELIMLRGDAADAYSYMSEERAAST